MKEQLVAEQTSYTDIFYEELDDSVTLRSSPQNGTEECLSIYLSVERDKENGKLHGVRLTEFRFVLCNLSFYQAAQFNKPLFLRDALLTALQMSGIRSSDSLSSEMRHFVGNAYLPAEIVTELLQYLNAGS